MSMPLSYILAAYYLRKPYKSFLSWSISSKTRPKTRFSASPKRISESSAYSKVDFLEARSFDSLGEPWHNESGFDFS